MLCCCFVDFCFVLFFFHSFQQQQIPSLGRSLGHQQDRDGLLERRPQLGRRRGRVRPQHAARLRVRTRHLAPPRIHHEPAGQSNEKDVHGQCARRNRLVIKESGVRVRHHSNRNEKKRRLGQSSVLRTRREQRNRGTRKNKGVGASSCRLRAAAAGAHAAADPVACAARRLVIFFLFFVLFFVFFVLSGAAISTNSTSSAPC